MVSKLTLSVSMVVIAALATSAGAATTKPPRDERCDKWMQRPAVTGNWVNAPRYGDWVCISGLSRGRETSAAGMSVGPSGGSSGGSSSGETPVTGGKGNNGIGNGLDPQPKGNPKPNDTDL